MRRAMKILAVDDDPDFLSLFGAVLKRIGYSDVVLARSGEDALREIFLSPSKFECIILDIQMPVMDGIELCREIRRFPTYRDTPIMMNTVMNDRQHIDNAFAAGATDYLNKPIDELEIRTRLGVIERLVREGLRTQTALAKGSTSAATAPSYGFMDGIPMKRVEGAIDLFSMGNYLKTLGIFRALSMSVIAVSVSNARQIHDLEGGVVFGEVMIDVANCLSDYLKGKSGMIAYAGGGSFVNLLARSELEDEDKFCSQLTELVSDFQLIYSDLGILMPRIAVGHAVRCRASHLRSPARIIDDAIASVQQSTFPIRERA